MPVSNIRGCSQFCLKRLLHQFEAGLGAEIVVDEVYIIPGFYNGLQSLLITITPVNDEFLTPDFFNILAGEKKILFIIVDDQNFNGYDFGQSWAGSQ